MIRFLPVLLLTGITLPLTAQPPKPSPWSAGVAVGWDSQPYVDADGQWIGFPTVSYRGEVFEWQGPRVLAHILKSRTLTLTTSLGLQFPAYEEEDSELLEGMGDRSYTLLTGLSAEWTFMRPLSLEASVQAETLGAYSGIQASAALAYQLGSPRSPFPLFGSIQAGITWQDENWTEDFVGVPVGKARPGRPAYSPDDSLHPFVALSAIYRISDSWSALLLGRIDFLDDTWTDSPLIEREHRGMALLSVQYAF